MRKTNTCWKKRKQTREKYYRNLLETYQPSDLGLSKTREVLHYYKIQMSERNGGGKAIRIVLHFLLQNKVTSVYFDTYYRLALEYALKTLVTGRVYYDKLHGKFIEDVSDVEQL